MKLPVYILALLVGLLPVVGAISSPLITVSAEAASCCCAPDSETPAAGGCCCCVPGANDNEETADCGCSFVPLEIPDALAVPAASDIGPCKKPVMTPALSFAKFVPALIDAHSVETSRPGNLATGPPTPVLYCTFLC